MRGLNWSVKAYCAFLFWSTMAVALPAQTFTTLHSFDNTDGLGPSGLVQATNGNLYGTTVDGGANGYGTVFRVTVGGKLTTLHSFDYPEGGAYPYRALVQAADGNFYGTTQVGGGSNNCPPGCGTVFKITPNGELITLHSFDGTDGEYPNGLVLATNGKFYGTTYSGGANGDGTVFKIALNGSLTTLHSFDNTDGAYPAARLAQAANDSFYGTTSEGGADNDGTVFKMTPNGTLTTLHSFDKADGQQPAAGLIQGSNGSFYGTTSSGGANTSCSNGYGCGTVFKITPSGALTTLYNFCSQSNCSDGANSYAALVEGTDGNFYGTTDLGGGSSFCYARDPLGCGTVFEITPGGVLTTLYRFCSQSNCTDGIFSDSPVVQDTSGMFYGTTALGGANISCNGNQGCGTVFSLSVGLGPFVKTEPASGTVGAAVTILGTGLGHATNVRFNGLESKFTIVSASEITTTVPNGATTGPVRVITPNGKLQSNAPFRVK
jgi:uncharacterized repeat protein (TIGR03803 family)